MYLKSFAEQEIRIILCNRNDLSQSQARHVRLHVRRYGRYNTCVKLMESTSAGPKVINEIDGRGHSPLHCAAEGGHVKVVRLLLARGATCMR